MKREYVVRVISLYLTYVILYPLLAFLGMMLLAGMGFTVKYEALSLGVIPYYGLFMLIFVALSLLIIYLWLRFPHPLSFALYTLSFIFNPLYIMFLPFLFYRRTSAVAGYFILSQYILAITALWFPLGHGVLGDGPNLIYFGHGLNYVDDWNRYQEKWLFMCGSEEVCAVMENCHPYSTINSVYIPPFTFFLDVLQPIWWALSGS